MIEIPHDGVLMHMFQNAFRHSIEVGYLGSIYSIKLVYTNKLVLDLLFLLIV